MPVPALIVSGYLGSGKTTLVGRLLADAQAQGIRLAIISNEFGDTGIDRALLDAGQDGLVELDGGCVCCRLSDALGETLEKILTEVRPDRLVLETSGVALPGDVLIQFWRAPVDALVSDEVVVVLVDGDRMLRTEELEETFLDQVEAADLLLLNKCDLMDEDGMREVEGRLAELTGGQPVLRTVHAEVDPVLLYPPDPEGERAARRDPDRVDRPHTHERFGTEVMELPAGLSAAEVLARVIAADAVRAKGFVQIDEGLRILQGVGPRVELSEPDNEVPAELVGRVVLIRRFAGHDDHP